MEIEIGKLDAINYLVNIIDAITDSLASIGLFFILLLICMSVISSGLNGAFIGISRVVSARPELYDISIFFLCAIALLRGAYILIHLISCITPNIKATYPKTYRFYAKKAKK